MQANWNPFAQSNAYLVSRPERDIGVDILDGDGKLKIMPASYYATTTPVERMYFGSRNGIYSLPTEELVTHLRTLIDGRKAIEIGAGNGVLAEALGIKATDSYVQARADVRKLYEERGLTIVKYGKNVERIEAVEAARAYRPQVIIGCWLTHRYRPEHHERGGNEFGADEKLILKYCDTFVLIGNTNTHRMHPLLSKPHDHDEPEWLYSRAMEGKDFIGIWKGKRF